MTTEVKYHISKELRKAAMNFGYLIPGIYTVEYPEGPPYATCEIDSFKKYSGMGLREIHSAAAIFIKTRSFYYVFKCILGQPTSAYKKRLSEEEKSVLENEILSFLREKTPEKELRELLLKRALEKQTALNAELSEIQEIIRITQNA